MATAAIPIPLIKSLPSMVRLALARTVPRFFGMAFGVCFACAFGVLLSAIGWGPSSLTGWLLLLAGAAVIAGGVVGYTTVRIVKRIDAKRAAKKRAEQSKRKAERLEAFMTTQPEETNLKFR